MNWLTKRGENGLQSGQINAIDTVVSRTTSGTDEVETLLRAAIATGKDRAEVERSGYVRVDEHDISFRTRTRVKIG
ncbi:MAG: hypothetical protein ABIG32_03360 [Candidatus Uhrbacteria bacterium]|nr:hypothetical protein [Patescibacteria group bacterium]MBU1906605.1 hypothetical protein [Patescibacteria group bacterium]